MTEKKFEIVCSPELMKKIEDHCFSAVDVEVGGFLVGEVKDGKSIVTHVIKAKNTSAQSTQLTFTNKTWETAWSEIAEIGKEAKLVGWFHSHPNFGVFLSDYDKFIQNQFFNEDGMITIVVDPIRGKRGWFVSIDKEVRPFAPEEDTTREKLGESKKDADSNIDAIIERSREKKGGISTGKAVAIAAIFSVFSFIGGYALTGLQLVDYKGRLDRVEQGITLLTNEIVAAQSKNQTPAPENTGAPAPAPKPVVTSKGKSSGKNSTTSSTTTTKTAFEGTECTKEGNTTTSNGKPYTCMKAGKDKKLKWVSSPTKTSASSNPVSTASPSASKSSSPTPVTSKSTSTSSTSTTKPTSPASQNPVAPATPQPEPSGSA